MPSLAETTARCLLQTVPSPSAVHGSDSRQSVASLLEHVFGVGQHQRQAVGGSHRDEVAALIQEPLDGSPLLFL